MPGSLYRLSAFTTTIDGGNPAGVWIGDSLPSAAEMQSIAADVGFSETAFIAPREGHTKVVRYYSPLAEVPFCGHATIASGVQLGQLSGPGEYRFDTRPGRINVSVSDSDGRLSASLVSVEPEHKPAPETLLSSALSILRWHPSELDPQVPAVIAYAGAWHLVVAVRDLDRLNRLEYDFDVLKSLMLEHDLTTLQLVLRESHDVFHARNPFPVGGVVEDPATGAAAAALGGYLREAALVSVPARVLIRQGEAMGRPSRLLVDIPESGGIMVTGNAVQLPEDYPPIAQRPARDQ